VVVSRAGADADLGCGLPQRPAVGSMFADERLGGVEQRVPQVTVVVRASGHAHILTLFRITASSYLNTVQNLCYVQIVN
jgi:hypothetical protein